MEDTFVGVRFGEETNLTLCSSGGLLLEKGAPVVVADERGPVVGRVEKSPMPVFKPCQKSSARQVLRRAGKRDLAADERKRNNEHRARLYCRERARILGLDMKVSKVEFALSGRDAIFFFTADSRIDFRQLVRDLSRRFKTRVRMVHLGARDEAKLLGGVGICGKTLCCSSWMGDFRSISISMAKRQGLSLNPTKISGQCGRLLCCLKYEDDEYKKKRPPRRRPPRGHEDGPSEGAQTMSRNPIRPGLFDRPLGPSGIVAQPTPSRRLPVV